MERDCFPALMQNGTSANYRGRLLWQTSVADFCGRLLWQTSVADFRGRLPLPWTDNIWSGHSIFISIVCKMAVHAYKQISNVKSVMLSPVFDSVAMSKAGAPVLGGAGGARIAFHT